MYFALCFSQFLEYTRTNFICLQNETRRKMYIYYTILCNSKLVVLIKQLSINNVNSMNSM
jgi:hypothetical protein